jgi:hypothetical protein
VTPKESAVLVDRLAVAFPNSPFAERNSEAYERALLGLDATETQSAIDELIATSKFLPSVAEIRAEVTRAKTARVVREESARALRAGDGSGSLGPYPRGWADPLGRMLDADTRHDTMAREWYASKGKPYPGDPGAKFTEIAKAGARGEDVGDRMREVVR